MDRKTLIGLAVLAGAALLLAGGKKDTRMAYLKLDGGNS